MAAQTFSTSLNLDDASKLGLLNGEAVTIDSGATVTVNADNRWSQQAAVVGSTSINAVTGGKLLIDARDVWQVPFSASTGNVPALGTVGVQNSTGGTSAATGEFLGIWATGELIPRTAATAMPATGFVKFRSKVGAFVAAETVTLPGGATITSVDSGKRSTIDYVANYQGTVTVPRLGTFEARGDWYDLGTTSGANDQTFDYPFLGPCNGIQVETSAGSGVYEWYAQAGARWLGATVTLATDLRAKYFGQKATEIVATPATGSPTVLTAATTELVVGMPINASANFGNIALYIVAINPGVSFTVNANATGATSTTFVTWRSNLTLAKSGATAMGYLPPAGCKVRCPNLRLSTSVSGWAGNILPTTQADRHEFVTSSSGVVIMDTVDCAWYANITSPYSVDLRNVAQSISASINNVATTTYIDGLCTGYENGSSAIGLSLANCYGGGEVKNSRIARYSAAASGDIAFNMVDCSDFILSDNIIRLGGTNSTTRTRGNATVHSLQMQRCFRVSVIRQTIMTGRMTITGGGDIDIIDTRYCDIEQGTNPGATNALSAAIDINGGVVGCYVEGFSNLAGVSDVHPYTAVVNLSTGCANVEWRGAGTPAAPVNGGTVNPLRRVIAAVVTSGLTMRRVYFQNLATDFASITNTVQGADLIDCWGDGADANAFAGVNQTNKGCSWTNSTTGQNAVYGSHWEHAWTSTTAGRVVIKGNEPTPDSVAQCIVTAGTPKFTSTGNLSAPTLGDQVEWECPFFIIGLTSMANVAPTITGTNTGNFTLQFQYDVGAGYNGSWLTLNAANLSGIGAIAPSTGIRFKVRATTATANATNALTYIRFDTVTNATDQQTQYPLPFTASAVITGIVAGSRLQVWNVTTNAEIANEAIPGTLWTLGYNNGTGMTAGDLIRVRLSQTSGATAQAPWEAFAVASATGWSVLAQQAAWTIYNLWAIDGSAQTQYSRDGANIDIDITAGGSYTKKSIAAWWGWLLTTEEGIRDFWAAYTFESPASIRQDVAIVDVLLQNTDAGTSAVFTDNDVRYYRSDFSLPYDDTPGFGSIFMDYAGVPLVLTTGGSALTPTESAHLLGLDTANLDAAVSTRLAAAAYDAPDNAGIAVAASGAISTIAELAIVRNLIEADEVHTATTVEKRLRGTATALLTKNHSGTPLATFQAVEP